MKQNRSSSLIIYILLIVFGTFFLFPFIWLMLSSLKEKTEIFAVPLTIFPTQLMFDNYTRAVASVPIVQYSLNTVFVAVMATLGTVVIASITGYAFAKINFKLRDQLFVLVLTTFMLPSQVVLIPTFVLFAKVGLVNSLWSLVLPRFIDAFYIFLMRQAFTNVPDEIIEAAKIDGCSHYRIFGTIAFPLVVPTVVTVIIFEINARWQDLMGPMIFLRDQTKYTMAVGLQSFQSLYGTQWDLLLAACVLFTLPMIILFACFQNYFISGIATSGLKG